MNTLLKFFNGSKIIWISFVKDYDLKILFSIATTTVNSVNSMIYT
jgi:hypothetical protein